MERFIHIHLDLADYKIAGMVDPVGAPAILGSLGEDRQRGTLQLQKGSNSHQERTLSGD